MPGSRSPTVRRCSRGAGADGRHDGEVGGGHGPAGYSGTGAGYHVCLDQLEELLDTGGPTIPDEAGVADLESRYAALVDA